MRRLSLVCVFVVLATVSNGQNLASMIEQAEAKLKSNHYVQAFQSFNYILDNYEDRLTYLQQAEIYNHLGFLNLMFLDPGAAERDLDRSLLYHEEAGFPDEKSYAEALLNTGMLYLEQVEFDLARDHVKQAISILKKEPGWVVPYLIARTKLARIYEEAGSYTLALSIYDESYDKLIALGQNLSPDFADICSHKGRILILTGKPKEGEDFINLSATIYTSLGPSYDVQRAESLEDLALFYERMGRYDDAEALLLEILELKRSIPDEAEILIIETLNDLGIMYNQLGRYRKAEEMFKEVVLACEENVGVQHPFYATAKNNLGTIALNRGDYNQAKLLLDEALVQFRNRFGPNHPYSADVLNNLARAERKLGNLSRAESYYREVLKVDEKLYGRQHPNYATTLLNIGILLSSDNRESEAENYYEEALSIRERALGINHPSYGSALEHTGIHYVAVGKLEEAEGSFRKAIEIQMNQAKALFPIMSEQERELFYLQLEEDVSRYHYIASLLLAKQPALIRQMFDFEVKTQRLLFNSLDKIKESMHTVDDPAMVAEYQQWISAKQLLANYYQMGVDQLASLHVNLHLVESDIAVQEARLKTKVSAFNDVFPGSDFSWEDVPSLVRNKEAIVQLLKVEEFAALRSSKERLYGFTGRSRYLAIIFNSGATEPDFAFLGPTALDSEHFKNCDPWSPVTSVGFETYWMPVMEGTSEAEALIVIPDGMFQTFSPNLFKVGKKDHVADRQYVYYVGSMLDFLQDDVDVLSKKLCVLGEVGFDHADITEFDLTHSKADLAFLSSFRPSVWKIATFTGAEANEHAVRTQYAPTILHLNAPAFVEAEKPFLNDKTPLIRSSYQSGFFLAGVVDSHQKYTQGIPTIPENDGVLTVYEAQKLELDRTRLVFLSSVALEEENFSSGAGFGELVNAFTVAGARNVIASVRPIALEWKSAFMELFYNQFNEDESDTIFVLLCTAGNEEQVRRRACLGIIHLKWNRILRNHEIHHHISVSADCVFDVWSGKFSQGSKAY